MTAIDISRTIEIAQSPWKLLGLLALGILMTALAASIAFHAIPVPPGSDKEFVGYVGTLFFGLCTILIAWRLVAASGGTSVVTLSPAGIRDIRIAAETIPWSAVTQVSSCRIQRQKFIVLTVDPAVEAVLTLTRIARWSRGANKALGIDGLCVAAQGLKADYDSLMATVLAYAEAGTSGARPPGETGRGTRAPSPRPAS